MFQLPSKGLVATTFLGKKQKAWVLGVQSSSLTNLAKMPLVTKIDLMFQVDQSIVSLNSYAYTRNPKIYIILW